LLAALSYLLGMQEGRTLLFNATGDGCLEVVQALLEGGADVNKATKVGGCREQCLQPAR